MAMIRLAIIIFVVVVCLIRFVPMLLKTVDKFGSTDIGVSLREPWTDKIEAQSQDERLEVIA